MAEVRLTRFHAPCILRLQVNATMFGLQKGQGEVCPAHGVEEGSSRRFRSLGVCSKRVNWGTPDTITSQATYPIPYRVLNTICPLIVRGTPRSIWTSYEEGTSILSCCANTRIQVSLPPFADTQRFLYPPDTASQGTPESFVAAFDPVTARACLECPTLNQNPPHSTLYMPAHKPALLP
jgi:hypothetical protein